VPRFDHDPTGELILKIRNASYLGIRQSLGDGKVQKLETCLGKFIAGLQPAARAIKEHREERERREREWEGQRKLWKEQQRLEKIEKLSRDLANWKIARNIREYLVEIGSLVDQVEGLDEWIKRSAEKTVRDIRRATRRHTGLDQVKVSHKPRLLSDNGPCYISGELSEYLEDNDITHTRGRPCHPQTQGKIERWHRIMKNQILLNNYSPQGR